MPAMLMPDPDATVGFLLHDVSRLIRAHFDQRAQSMGLTRAQWRVLVHLAPRQGINQRALAEILELDTVTLGRHIDRLERDGWLRRRADPADRRAWQLFLTETLQPTLDRMASLAIETNATALAGFSPEEQALLVAMLTRIKDNMAASSGREQVEMPVDQARRAAVG